MQAYIYVIRRLSDVMSPCDGGGGRQTNKTDEIQIRAVIRPKAHPTSRSRRPVGALIYLSHGGL